MSKIEIDMGDTANTKPRVVHVKKSEYDLYIGRKFAGFEASKWANPYTIGKDGTREEVLVKYEAYLKRTPELMKALPELENKTLACWCKGTNGAEDVACHGDVLVRLLEEEKAKQIAPIIIAGAENPVRVLGQEILARRDELAKQEMTISEPKRVAPILPVFASDSSFGESLLSFEEPGKTIPGNPLSVFDLALEYKLPYVTLVDSRIDGFLWAYEASEKTKIPMVFGVKMVVCDDLMDKNDVTKRNESKVIVLLKNSQGYQDLLPIWNKANVEGLFRPKEPGGPVEQYGRIDWSSLVSMWTPNLGFALPFFSSFVARNALRFANIVPTLPVPMNEIIAFRELDSRLPFSDVLDKALDQFVVCNPAVTVQPIKTVYYRSSADFESYVLRRAIHERGEFSRPNVDNLASDRFSMQAWKELMS